MSYKMWCHKCGCKFTDEQAHLIDEYHDPLTKETVRFYSCPQCGNEVDEVVLEEDN